MKAKILSYKTNAKRYHFKKEERNITSFQWGDNEAGFTFESNEGRSYKIVLDLELLEKLYTRAKKRSLRIA